MLKVCTPQDKALNMRTGGTRKGLKISMNGYLEGDIWAKNWQRGLNHADSSGKNSPETETASAKVLGLELEEKWSLQWDQREKIGDDSEIQWVSRSCRLL